MTLESHVLIISLFVVQVLGIKVETKVQCVGIVWKLWFSLSPLCWALGQSQTLSSLGFLAWAWEECFTYGSRVFFPLPFGVASLPGAGLPPVAETPHSPVTVPRIFWLCSLMPQGYPSLDPSKWLGEAEPRDSENGLQVPLASLTCFPSDIPGINLTSQGNWPF
jgi:hypothetical protein